MQLFLCLHWSFCFKSDYLFPLITGETHGYLKKRASRFQEGRSICTLSQCKNVSIYFIFICGRFVVVGFSVFSFVFYNVVKLWSSLLTYPKAAGQTVWQGSIICHHCTYGHSLRSLLKGALRSSAAVARLVQAPTSMDHPRMAQCPTQALHKHILSSDAAVNNTHITRERYLLQSPLVFSCYSRSPAALAVTAPSGESSVPVNTPQMNKLGAESTSLSKLYKIMLKST